MDSQDGKSTESQSNTDIQHQIFEVGIEEGGFLTCSSYNQDHTKLATADNKGILKIFTEQALTSWEQKIELNINNHLNLDPQILQEIGVTQISCIEWAHPQFGSILALGTNHGHVIFMREMRDIFQGGGQAEWKIEKIFFINQKIIQDIKFAPRQAGLLVAVAQGSMVRLFKGNEDLIELKWSLVQVLKFEFNQNNINFQPNIVNCVGWRISGNLHPIMLAAGGDLGLALWYFDIPSHGFKQINLQNQIQINEEILTLNWCPLNYRNNELLAVGVGSKIFIFGLKGSTQNLQIKQLSQLQQEGICNQICWDKMGLSFVASCLTQPPQSLLWKQSSIGEWKMVTNLSVSQLEEEELMENEENMIN